MKLLDARFSTTVGLEDGIIGCAGLSCIRAVLASESWCSFGGVDCASMSRWRATSVAVWALWQSMAAAAKLSGAQEAHSQFLAAAETSLDAFALLEAVRNDAGKIVDFRILYVNANAENDDWDGRGRNCWDRNVLGDTGPSERAGCLVRFCKVVESGEPLNEEFPVSVPGIKASWLRSQVVKLGDGLAFTFSDISEAKATQERYAHLAEFTDSVFQNAPFSIVATDTQWTDYCDECGGGEADGL